MAGWLTASKTVEVAYSDNFNRAGPALGASWTFIQGTDGTDAVIQSSVEAVEPSTATIAPWAFLNSGLSDTTLNWRAATDMRIKDASNAGNPGQFSRMSVHAYDTVLGSSRLLYAANLLGVATNKFRLERFTGVGTFGSVETSAQVDYSPASDLYYRVGLEVWDGRIRGYISSSSIAPGAGDSTLEARVELAATHTLTSNEVLTVGFLMTIAATGVSYSAIDNIKIERLPNPPFTGIGGIPSGSFFEGPVQTPYTLFKTHFYLHDLLTSARLF